MIWLRIHISYRVIKLSVRPIKYYTKVYARYYVESMPRSVNVKSVPSIDVTRTMTESIPSIIVNI